MDTLRKEDLEVKTSATWLDVLVGAAAILFPIGFVTLMLILMYTNGGT
jgi:hypothetical protein